MSTVQVERPQAGNLLINPGFEYKQRPAASFTGVNGSYTLDGWKSNRAGGASLVISQIPSTIGSAGNSAQLVCTFAAGAVEDLAQPLENYKQLAGQTLTFAVTVKCATPAAVRLYLYDGVTVSLSAFNVGGAAAERLVVTATMGASPTVVWVGVRCDQASCTVELNDATCCLGRVPLAYAPLHPAEDLERCQRLYERHGGANGSLLVQMYAFALNDWLGTWVSFATPKGGDPTTTRVGTWQAINCYQPTFNGQSRDGYALISNANVAPAVTYFHNLDATTYVSAEWNP